MQTGEGQRCSSPKSATLPPVGYLASSVTEHSNYGTSHCPWIIQVSPGQVVNVSLYDFSTWPAPSQSDDSVSAKACTIVGTISDGSRVSEIRSCYGYQRLTHVYTSQSNHISIEIFTAALRRKIYFLLKYEGNSYFSIPLQNLI